MINICLRCQRDCKSEKAVCGKFKSIDDKGFKRELRERFNKALKDGIEEATREIENKKKRNSHVETAVIPTESESGENEQNWHNCDHMSSGGGN